MASLARGGAGTEGWMMDAMGRGRALSRLPDVRKWTLTGALRLDRFQAVVLFHEGRW